MKKLLKQAVSLFAAALIAIQPGCNFGGVVQSKKDGNAQGYMGIINYVATRVSEDNEEGRKLAVQSDGKIIAAGWIEQKGEYSVAIVRYLPNGKLDPTFGRGGIATSHIPGTSFEVHDILIQPSDGKIVVCGATKIGDLIRTALIRFLPEGLLDENFGVEGLVETAFGNGDSKFSGLALQSDGRLVAGGVAVGASSLDYLVVRFLENGSLDPQFGTNGSTITALGMGLDYAWAIAVDSKDRIALAGTTQMVTGPGVSGIGTGLIRYSSTGQLDTSFGNQGVVRANLYEGKEITRAMVIQADDKVLIAGARAADSVDAILARFTVDGRLDNEFGNQGKLIPEIDGQSRISSLSLTADGKILAAGSTGTTEADGDFLVLKLDGKGQKDTSFGGGTGVAITSISSNKDHINGMAIQSDGRILALGGTLDQSGDYDFALARYLADGSADGSFSGDR